MNDLIDMDDIFQRLNDIIEDSHKEKPKPGSIESSIYILEEDTRRLREKLRDRGNRKQLIQTRKEITENAKALKKLKRKKK